MDETSLAPATASAASEKTLADTAYRHIRADLLAGRLAPGSRLRPPVLQASYGLGLSPVREALLRLAVEGLVVGEGQRGFAVAPVSLEELEDLTRTRQQIESLALAQAIDQGDEEWEAGIVAAFHRLSRTPMPDDAADTQAVSRWERAHRAFHQALIAACGSPWLLRFQAQLVDHSDRYRRARLFDPGAARTPTRGGDREAEHRALMEAALARDAAKAAALMHEHLQHTAAAAARGLAAPEGKS